MEITDQKIIFSSVKLKNMTFTTLHPNNIAIMNNGTVIVINSIFARAINNIGVGDILIEGKRFTFDGDVFDYPILSREVGIMFIRECENKIERYFVKDISQKCICTELNNRKIIITLLHL